MTPDSAIGFEGSSEAMLLKASRSRLKDAAAGSRRGLDTFNKQRNSWGECRSAVVCVCSAAVQMM